MSSKLKPLKVKIELLHCGKNLWMWVRTEYFPHKYKLTSYSMDKYHSKETANLAMECEQVVWTLEV